MELSQQHFNTVKTDFPELEIPAVLSELSRLTTKETWGSEYNLENAIGAILNLSKGDLKTLKQLVEAARIDFRDVIYW